MFTLYKGKFLCKVSPHKGPCILPLTLLRSPRRSFATVWVVMTLASSALGTAESDAAEERGLLQPGTVIATTNDQSNIIFASF